MNQIPLTNLSEGQEAEIVSVAGVRMAAKRLADLGLVSGTRIKILRKAIWRGPIEIEIKGSKLVLGRGLAAKILVKLL